VLSVQGGSWNRNRTLESFFQERN